MTENFVALSDALNLNESKANQLVINSINASFVSTKAKNELSVHIGSYY